MNKQELMTAMAEHSKLTKQQAAAALDALSHVVKVTTAKGDAVKIQGFGQFKLRDVKARMGRNPQTGEPREIPAHSALVFKAAKPSKGKAADLPADAA